MERATVRERFRRALAGERVTHPVYAVYDWFVQNRPAVDWESLLDLGLGQINHANLIRVEHPNFGLGSFLGNSLPLMVAPSPLPC